MPDREKVIEGLKFTKAMITFNPSTGEDIEPGNLNEADKTTYDACVGAIALLKEQDAKNVVDMRLSKDWFRIASCPRCNELLNWVYHRKNCGYCGQAVKWEEC